MKPHAMLGLVVISVAAAVWVITPIASAAKFTAGKLGAVLSEETTQDHIFNVTGFQAGCDEFNLEGETKALESDTLSVSPVYKKCFIFGSESTTVNTEGCIYKFTAATNEQNQAVMHLEKCKNGGITITIHVFTGSKCVIHIKNQELSGVSYSNGEEGHLNVDFNIGDMHAQVKKEGPLCFLTTGTHSNMSYTGESKLRAAGTTLAWSP